MRGLCAGSLLPLSDVTCHRLPYHVATALRAGGLTWRAPESLEQKVKRIKSEVLEETSGDARCGTRGRASAGD